VRTKKVCVLGHFGFGKELINGQTIKTKTLANTFDEVFGRENVLKIDTHGGIKALFLLPIQVTYALFSCENVVLLPAQRGVQLIVPLVSLLNRIFHRNTYYSVIGGWLPELIKKRKMLKYSLSRLTKIWVETTTLLKRLENSGLNNVQVVPNFKKIHILSETELIFHQTEPLPLCSFSRVNKKKGIEDAVDAVNKINKKNGRQVFSLDIYGPIDKGEMQWYEEIQHKFTEGISYKGVIPPEESVNVIKNYYALLFPTQYFTEGVPASIIDSYSAGVPVVCSQWESFADVVVEGKTGISFDFGSTDGLLEALEKVKNPSTLNEMKINCIVEAQKYQPLFAIDIMGLT